MRFQFFCMLSILIIAAGVSAELQAQFYGTVSGMEDAGTIVAMIDGEVKGFIQSDGTSYGLFDGTKLSVVGNNEDADKIITFQACGNNARQRSRLVNNTLTKIDLEFPGGTCKKAASETTTTIEVTTTSINPAESTSTTAALTSTTMEAAQTSTTIVAEETTTTRIVDAVTTTGRPDLTNIDDIEENPSTTIAKKAGGLEEPTLINKEKTSTKVPWYKKPVWWIIGIVIILVIVGLVLASSDVGPDKQIKKAAKLHRHAEEYYQDGDVEEAEELYKAAQELRENSE